MRPYSLWAFLRLVPKKAQIIKSSSGLIGFSNSITSEGDNHKRRKEIAENLGIKILQERWGE